MHSSQYPVECSLKQIAFWDTKQGLMEYQQVSVIACILPDHNGITLQISAMETAENKQTCGDWRTY